MNIVDFSKSFIYKEHNKGALTSKGQYSDKDNTSTWTDETDPTTLAPEQMKRTIQTDHCTPHIALSTKAIKKKKYVSDTRTHCYVNSISRVGLRAGP